MTPRIENAINVFLKTLENGTLVKGYCAACAVGNLVADGLGAKLTVDLINKLNIKCEKSNFDWADLFYTVDGVQNFNKNYIDSSIIANQIKVTRFSLWELMEIEFAFETNTKIKGSYNNGNYGNHTKEEVRADQLKGLEAVVEVMLDFDDVKESIQKIFTSKAELISV